MSKVVIITGPCGAGKTTIATVLAERLQWSLLKGDDIKEELFPGLTDISQHPHELATVKSEILKRATDYYENNESVLIDYVVVGDFIDSFKEKFGDDFCIKVLLPNIEENARRDSGRDCWQAGKDHIAELHNKFLRDEHRVGKENFFDTTTQSLEETIHSILESIQSNL